MLWDLKQVRSQPRSSNFSARNPDFLYSPQHNSAANTFIHTSIKFMEKIIFGNNMKLIWLFLPTIILLGCASPVQQYEPPQEEGNAILKFSAAGLRSFYFHENGNNCTETRRLTTEDDPLQNSSRSLVIPANKQIALTLLWADSRAREVIGCGIILSFSLQPNRSYRLVGGMDDDRCWADILDAQSSTPVRSSINLKQMKNVQSTQSLLFGTRASSCAIKQ